MIVGKNIFYICPDVVNAPRLVEAGFDSERRYHMNCTEFVGRDWGRCAREVYWSLMKCAVHFGCSVECLNICGIVNPCKS